MCVLQRLSLSYLRIDGQTEIHLRNERVRKFQEEAYSCMLLTTKVGGFGAPALQASTTNKQRFGFRMKITSML